MPAFQTVCFLRAWKELGRLLVRCLCFPPSLFPSLALFFYPPPFFSTTPCASKIPTFPMHELHARLLAPSPSGGQRGAAAFGCERRRRSAGLTQIIARLTSSLPLLLWRTLGWTPGLRLYSASAHGVAAFPWLLQPSSCVLCTHWPLSVVSQFQN